jgi:hypothetical protein
MVTGEPFPIQFESSPVPANNSFGLHDDECVLPARPKFAKEYPEQSICCTKPRVRVHRLQSAKLLTQCQILQEQVIVRTKHARDQTEEKSQQSEHVLL